ncbi:MAG: hypothetical protein HY903_11640 [Deltaproteobacteria bacterium]|nr:hypothetical protein [Deltaproteobacteria bacterium]
MATTIGAFCDLLVAGNVDIQKLTAKELQSRTDVPPDLRGMGWDKLLRQLRDTDAKMRAAQRSVDLGPKVAAADQRRGATGAGSVVGVIGGQGKRADGAAAATAFATVPPVEIPQRDSFSASEFVQLAEKQKSGLQDKLTELAGVRQRQQHQAEVTLRDRDVALEQLLQAILPDMTPASAATATKLLGWPARQLPDVAAEQKKLERPLAEAQAALKAALAGLGAKVGVAADAALGVAERKLTAATKQEQEVAAELQKFGKAKALIEAGWDTSSYSHWKLSPSWFSDKNAANEVVAKLGLANFGAVRAAYEKLGTALHGARSQVADLRAQVGEARDLKTRADGLQAQLDDLPARTLAKARDAVATYLRGAPKEELGKTLTDEGIVRLYKAYGALSAKVEYMTELGQKMIELERDVAKDKQQLDQEIARYKGKDRSAVLPQDKVKYKLGNTRWQQRDKQYRGYTSAYDRVYGYRSYDSSPSLLTTWFWWNVFSSGHTTNNYYNGYFTPTDVAEHVQANPDYAYTDRPAKDADAAAAVAQSDAVGSRDPQDVSGSAANAWGDSSRISS